MHPAESIFTIRNPKHPTPSISSPVCSNVNNTAINSSYQSRQKAACMLPRRCKFYEPQSRARGDR